jgi:hypothetical protein
MKKLLLGLLLLAGVSSVNAADDLCSPNVLNGVWKGFWVEEHMLYVCRWDAYTLTQDNGEKSYSLFVKLSNSNHKHLCPNSGYVLDAKCVANKLVFTHAPVVKGEFIDSTQLKLYDNSLKKQALLLKAK